MLLGFLAAALASPAAWAGGDPERGQAYFESRCLACHSLDHNKVGPRLRGVFGRVAGSVPRFRCSNAVKRAGFAWDRDRLEAWLTNPQALLPGARMPFRVRTAADRADIISFLKRTSGL